MHRFPQNVKTNMDMWANGRGLSYAGIRPSQPILQPPRPILQPIGHVYYYPTNIPNALIIQQGPVQPPPPLPCHMAGQPGMQPIFEPYYAPHTTAFNIPRPQFNYEDNKTMPSPNQHFDTNNTQYINQQTKTCSVPSNFLQFMNNNCKNSKCEEITEQELLFFTLNGCYAAEKVTQEYGGRFCFNKLDLVFQRLKDEATYRHIESDINSQGTVWAVRDFVMTFNFMMDAWQTIQSYINCNDQRLSGIKSEYTDDLITSFAVWQNHTHTFGANLMKTFLSLNAQVITQQTSSSTKVDNEVVNQSDNGIISQTTESHVLAQQVVQENTTITYLSESSTLTQTMSSMNYENPVDTNAENGYMKMNQTDEEKDHKSDNEDNDIQIMTEYLSNYTSHYYPENPQTPLDPFVVGLLNELITRVENMQYAINFLHVNEMKLHFLHFCNTTGRGFLDIHTILLFCKYRVYRNITDAVFELKRIPHLVKMYSFNNVDLELIEKSKLFEMELDEILKQPPFDKINFNFQSLPN